MRWSYPPFKALSCSSMQVPGLESAASGARLKIPWPSEKQQLSTGNWRRSCQASHSNTCLQISLQMSCISWLRHAWNLECAVPKYAECTKHPNCEVCIQGEGFRLRQVLKSGIVGSGCSALGDPWTDKAGFRRPWFGFVNPNVSQFRVQSSPKWNPESHVC